MATKKLRCVALGKDLETLQELAGEWLCSTPDEDFMEYDVEGTGLEIFLQVPGSTKSIPRPVDILLIFVSENTDVAALRAVYENFKGVVFKAVVGDDGNGLAFANEINAKYATLGSEQDSFLSGLISLNGELNDLMKKTFDSIDTDGSGYVDMNELTNLSKTLGHDLTEAELKQVFEELDENKDQKISYKEFVKWFKSGRRGKGNLMKKMVAVQTKAKRFLEGAHAEVASLAQEATEDALNKVSFSFKVGDVPADSPLGFNIRINTGDNTERDAVIGAGALDENERAFFSRLSIKIAEGVDPENARDKLSSVWTKGMTKARQMSMELDQLLEYTDIKFRVRDGHIDVYFIYDTTAEEFAMFQEEVVDKLEGFIPTSITQEITASLNFSKGLSDVRNVGDNPIYTPLLEGISIEAKAQLWNKLQQVVLTVAESEIDHMYGGPPKEMLIAGLFNGGELNLKFGSFNEVPTEIQGAIAEMLPLPSGSVVFEQLLPAMLGQAYEEQPYMQATHNALKEFFVADTLSIFAAFKQFNFSVNSKQAGLGSFF